MEMKKYPIKSYWQTETGRFDKETCSFVNRKMSPIREKEIFVTYKKGILKFHKGPTGFESYYLESLEQTTTFSTNPNFCICAGTINSWLICYVMMDDLKKIIKKIKKEHRMY